jgi:hypothetical protein
VVPISEQTAIKGKVQIPKTGTNPRTGIPVVVSVAGTPFFIRTLSGEGVHHCINLQPLLPPPHPLVAISSSGTNWSDIHLPGANTRLGNLFFTQQQKKR